MYQEARKVGDANIPRSWSRHSLKKEGKVTQDGKKLGEDKSVAKAKGSEENLKMSTENDDPQLQEFLEVMQPRTKSKLWANDSVAVLDNASIKQENGSRDISVPVHAEVVQIGSSDDQSSKNHKSKKSNALVHDDVISDTEYFKSRVTKKWSDSESSDSESNDNDEDNSEASMSRDDDEKGNDSHSDEDEKYCDNKTSKVDGRRSTQIFNPPSQEDIRTEDGDHKNAELNDHSNYSGDKVPKQGVPSSSLEDEKGVFEPCRLFVQNVPFTAT